MKYLFSYIAYVVGITFILFLLGQCSAYLHNEEAAMRIKEAFCYACLFGAFALLGQILGSLNSKKP